MWYTFSGIMKMSLPGISLGMDRLLQVNDFTSENFCNFDVLFMQKLC